MDLESWRPVCKSVEVPPGTTGVVVFKPPRRAIIDGVRTAATEKSKFEVTALEIEGQNQLAFEPIPLKVMSRSLFLLRAHCPANGEVIIRFKNIGEIAESVLFVLEGAMEPHIETKSIEKG
jgi:hypothetical protein